MAKDRKITEEYLPSELYGRVEASILACSPLLAAEFIPPAEVEERIALRLMGAPIANCIEDLTARFPDGPTYFLIVRSDAPTAMVAAFGDFQCLVFAEALHGYFSLVASGVLEWEPLRAFLENGGEPEDDGSQPIRSRSEALETLISRQERPSPEAMQWTATIGYFLMYFLAAHELGHFALGHLGSNDRKHGRMTEAEDEHPTDKVLESRALEWEADGFAAMAAVWQAASLRDRGDPPWPELIKDHRSCVRVFMTGAYILFSIMDLASPAKKAPELRTHPAPMVRVGLAALLLTVATEMLGMLPGDQVQEEARRSIKAVEIALNKTGGGLMERSLAEALGGEAFGTVDALYAAREAAKPNLDRSRLQGYFWARPFD